MLPHRRFGQLLIWSQSLCKGDRDVDQIPCDIVEDAFFSQFLFLASLSNIKWLKSCTLIFWSVFFNILVFNFVLLVYRSIVPVPCCFYYYGSVINLEI